MFRFILLLLFVGGGLANFIGGPLAADDPGESSKKGPVTTPAAGEVAERLPPEAERSLDILIAEHVILWDGKLVSWDEVIAGLREIRKRGGKPIKPSFHFTNGAVKAGYELTRQRDLIKHYQELFEPVGMSLRIASPRASARYDAIKGAADLVVPPEEACKGIVRAPGGRAVRVGIVVLLPEDEDTAVPIMLTPDLTLRDQLDEVWARLDDQGRFEIRVRKPGQRLAVLSPIGFAVANIPQPGELARITLTPNATLEISSRDQEPQELGLTIRPADFPETFSGFSIYEVKIGEKAGVLRLPPGQIAVSRTFDQGNGRSLLVQAERLELKAGERRTLSLAPVEPTTLPDK